MLDIKKFLKSIENLEYVLVKLDVPYMPADFPDSYPVGKDLDVFVSEKDFEKLKEKVDFFANEYDEFEKEIVEEPNNYRYRFMQDGKLHYQIDVFTKTDFINDKFVGESISNRQNKKGFFVCKEKHEIHFRIMALLSNPNKKYHVDYIRRNKKFLSASEIKSSPIRRQYRLLMLPLPYIAILFLKKVKRKLARIKREIKQNAKIFKSGVYSDLIVKQETGKLLAKQFTKGKFNRYDTIVRYMAVESFFGKNEDGFKLYDKMQEARIPSFAHIAKGRFIELIKSIDDKGFDSHSALPIYKNQHLQDGSHRLACALYFGVKEIPVNITGKDECVEYGLDWFKSSGFTDEEIEKIEAKRKELFKNWGLYFQVIIWPPAAEFFDVIEKEISEKFEILSSKTIDASRCFEQLMFDIYASDDIAAWKIEKKIRGMKKYNKHIKIIDIHIEDPRFRKKERNNHDISTVVEKTKLYYRTKYGEKIPNYFYDIVMHIGDNYHHTKEIAKAIEKADVDII